MPLNPRPAESTPRGRSDQPDEQLALQIDRLLILQKFLMIALAPDENAAVDLPMVVYHLPHHGPVDPDRVSQS